MLVMMKIKSIYFSLSTYYGLTEIHDFDENFNNKHKTWLTTNFIGINNERRYHKNILIHFLNN